MELVDLGLLIARVILAAAIGEGVIEFIPVPILNVFLPNVEENKPVRTVILNLLSALLGAGIALNFALGLFALLGARGLIFCLDPILTGILLGRGSNYIHAFVKKFILDKTG